mmetsp:Transcript_22104/g.26981  ORF Transcript_22104/g.26981 Transcript_22104/m.26981 type:complete len:99 (-) Transcript_22104:279-575(-)
MSFSPVALLIWMCPFCHGKFTSFMETLDILNIFGNSTKIAGNKSQGWKPNLPVTKGEIQSHEKLLTLNQSSRPSKSSSVKRTFRHTSIGNTVTGILPW